MKIQLAILGLLSLGPCLFAEVEVPCPAVVENYVSRTNTFVSNDALNRMLEDFLWKVYEQPRSIKAELVRYIEGGKNDIRIVFCGIALIPFHDPTSVEAVLKRATSESISEHTRWYLLYAEPLILSIGDQWYSGNGSLDLKTKAHIARKASQLTNILRTGYSEFFSAEAEKYFKLALKEKNEESGEAGLAFWHVTAYLLGTLHTGAHTNFRALFNEKYYKSPAFANVFNALQFASNDPLYPKSVLAGAPITHKIMDDTAQRALFEWERYAKTHSNWQEAVLSNFEKKEILLVEGASQAQLKKELLKALKRTDEITAYNTLLYLNRTYDKCFDLETIFNSGKYAMTFSHSQEQSVRNYRKTVKFWERFLNGL